MKIQNLKGFTMIEMLMVILLVAILAVVAIPQFIDFRVEAKDAATNNILGTVRTGIAMQYAQSLIRCGATPGTWPTAAGLNANDNGTAGGGACLDAEIPTASERTFIAQPLIPANPWGGVATVVECHAAPGTCGRATGGCIAVGFSGGWCYNNLTGDFWADSGSSTGPALEVTF